MVVVPIALSEKRKRGDGSLPEWAALEFQGELKKWKEKRGGQGSLEDDAIAKDPSDLKLFSSSFIPGLKFGLFQVDPKDDSKATIIVGHHKLEGKRVTLSKPLAVLKKHRVGEGRPDPGEEGGEEDEKGGDRSLRDANVKYNIEGVIRWKLIFKERPRLLISKGQRK